MANNVNGGSHSSIESLNGEFRKRTLRVLERNLHCVKILSATQMAAVWLSSVTVLYLSSHRLVGKAGWLVQKRQWGSAFSSHFRRWCDGRFTCRGCRGTVETRFQVGQVMAPGLRTRLWSDYHSLSFDGRVNIKPICVRMVRFTLSFLLFSGEKSPSSSPSPPGLLRTVCIKSLLVANLRS